MMRPENAIKSIDNLGRITLPKGLRDRLGFNGDMELFTMEEGGRTFICMAPPVKDDEVDRAIKLLEEKGFTVRTPQDEQLVDDLILMAQKFFRVVEVNWEEDTYFEVKAVLEDEGKVEKHFSAWVRSFARSNVHSDDADKFLRFFDDREAKVFYRRRCGGSWRLVCMERVQRDENIDVLVVRDVEDYVREYRRTMKDGDQIGSQVKTEERGNSLEKSEYPAIDLLEMCREHQ